MEKIVTLINNGEWQQAQVEFEKLSLLGVENTDEYAICGAEIYLALQDFEKAFSYIRLGLQHNYENYELYYILGKYYARINCNQAALCFEMATFYAKGSSDHNFLAQEFENYIHGYENEPERGKRCDKCFELRLTQTEKKLKN